MAIFDGKTIVLGVPKHYDWDRVIEAQLKGLGFNIINISFYNNQFKYKNRIQRLKSFFVREILGDRTYKTKLKYAQNRQWLEKEVAEIHTADYALIIRPDVYPIDFIKVLRTKVKKLIGYQWDGLDRFPRVYDIIGLFDRFFVFDGRDLNVPFVLPITNYYTETMGDNLYDAKLQSDVFYSGEYSRKRIAVLGTLIQDCRSLGLKANYHLYHRKDRVFPSYNISTASKQLTYEQNIRCSYNTKIILDLLNPVHNGLSFRFFEALLFDKKVITTNPRAASYDFYDPNNIFIWDNNSVDELRAFVELPYRPLPMEIKQKYSFTNWLHYALDEGEYTRLSIPC